MAPTKRNIFAGNPSADNHLQTVTHVDGGDDSTGQRGVDPAPAGTDQGSADTLDRRQAQAQAFREAQRLAEGVTDAGAPREQVGRGPDSFDHYAPGADVKYDGTGDVVAPEPPVITRNSGAANLDDSGPGQTIGR
jgi:hypothetical protein